MKKGYSTVQFEGKEPAYSLHNISSDIYSTIEDTEKLKEEFFKAKKLRKKNLWKSGGFTRHARKRRR